MSLPDFLCIGAQRAGTTWLYQMLVKHPEIFMSKQKELHFFDEKPDLSDYEGLGKPGRPFYYDMNSRAHWHWYAKQFRKGKNQRISGEITPYYAILSEERVKLIANKLPHLKIIYILRNPVKRAWSGFNLFLHNQGLCFSDLPEIEQIKKTIMHPTKLLHGDYQRNLNIWDHYFNPEQILYLFYDDIVLYPQDLLNRVISFLNVNPIPYNLNEITTKYNTFCPLKIPESIESLLTTHFATQFSFIRTKFGRSLIY